MQYSIIFNLRPVKIAYFVDSDNVEAFAEIARFCCTQWGGINNFVIPVSPTGVPPYFQKVLSAHPPDKVVSACRDHKSVLEQFCHHQYTLNTTVNRAMDQDVLAPILLLTKLAKERHPIYCQAIGLKLGTQQNPDIGDFDVVFVKEQRVYAGECKTGSQFKDKDIRMAELARDIGCSGFFFASCGGLDERSRQLIEGFKAKLRASDKPFDVCVYEENDLLVDT